MNRDASSSRGDAEGGVDVAGGVDGPGLDLGASGELDKTTGSAASEQPLRIKAATANMPVMTRMASQSTPHR